MLCSHQQDINAYITVSLIHIFIGDERIFQEIS